MRVRVLYFAAVRDLVALESEQLSLPETVRSVAQLATYLVQCHPVLDGKLGGVRFAVNEEFANRTHALKDGDAVAVIPPTAGG